MKENYTDITIVLDKSSSMEAIKKEVILGLNSFLASQRELPGECKISLVEFSDESNTVYSGVDVKFVANLSDISYRPFGCTALYDAVVRTIENTGMRLKSLPEESRPAKVIFVIFTDGEENSSRRHKAEDVQARISHQKEKYSWDFLYLGANQDAILNARKMGIDANSSATYTINNVSNVCDTFSAKVTLYRSATTLAEAKRALDFSKDERDNLVKQ